MQKRLRILVVDDCPVMTKSLAQLLNRWGHDVSLANDGHKALETALAVPFDMILLDIELPGLDGFEVVELLRKCPACDGTVLIAATGHSEEEYRLRAANAGFDHYLTKPISATKLRELLHPSASAVPG